MALTTYQTALNNWRARASQFATAGIPSSQWSQLYHQDMAGVMQGRTPMTNADVYAGVVSAVKGPQIQDPTNQIAHHSSILSTIGDVIKNAPKDVASMVTGLEGIPHILMHLPSEVDNTGKLLYNLAEGNNQWLQKNGYLPQGQQLHESWSDWSKILRAMNTNGSKQLLPFLPFISDIANMTNGQGRQYLQQHPVGAFLDVLPGIVKVGHLATDSMTLEANAEERFNAVEKYKQQGMEESAAQARVNREIPADYSNIYRTSAPGSRDITQPTKKFYAAGRALQTGNPVKALFSAAGDLIPAGRDEAGTRITARDYINMRAAASGLDIKIRKSLNRPINNLNDELSAASRHLRDKVFGNTTFFKRNANSVVRNQYMYMVTHGINPATGEMFKSVREQNAYINSTLDEHERADIEKATAISAKQQIEAVQSGRAVQIPDPHYGGVNLFRTDSRVHKAWLKAQDAAAELKALEGTGADYKVIEKAGAKLQKAYQDFRYITWEVAPDAWQPAIGEMMRKKYKTEVEARVAAGEMDAEDLRNIVADLATSPWESEYKRIMGEDAYQVYRDDAMQQWRILQSQGLNPLWTHEMDPSDYDVIFNPKVARLDKPVTPEAYSRETHTERGMYFGASVQNVGVLLSNHAIEVIRENAVSKFLHDIVIPQFTVDITKTRRDYYDALMSAAQAGKLKKVGPWSVNSEVNRIINANFRQFDPNEFGIKAEKAGIDPQTVASRYITKEGADALKRVFSESTFASSGLPIWRTGTKLYKFAVLTGVRHLVHVAAGSAMFMLARDPLAVRDLWTSHRAMRALRKGMVAEDVPALAKLGLTGHTASGIRERPYNLTSLHQYHNAQFGAQIGQDLATGWIHEARQKAVSVAEYLPQKLAALEEHILDMYRTSMMLSNYRRTGDATAALEAAHKTFVDVNGMTNIERTVIKQVFPFYAFTRHLFRYLFQYPVDYPLRAAIISQFAEGEQQDWNSGLPRSYMSLFWLGQPDKNGNIHTFDLKNLNPFRSFAGDFSMAGFLSSLSPFLTIPFTLSGVNLLSGTSQMYPGTVFNPQTGTLQATPQPGAPEMIAEQFVPQIGLLDHFFKLTNQTRALAVYDKNAYRNQLWNMLNLPFVPEVINVPYEKEITEMRRFRAAQTDLTNVENNPSAASINKLLQWNLVPWDNYLIPPQVLANYYSRVERALKQSRSVVVAPKAVLPTPPQHQATLGSF